MSNDISIQNETVAVLFESLNLPAEELSPRLKKLINIDSRYLKDLRINVSNAFKSERLSLKESYLIALAVATNEKHEMLANAFEEQAKTEGATEEEIGEVIACTSLMNTNNIFYRFRHFIGKDFYEQQSAGIKMNIMMKPVLGKEFFELLSLVISSLNGCEKCVTSHEISVIQQGGSEERIFDSVKLGAVLKGLIAIL